MVVPLRPASRAAGSLALRLLLLLLLHQHHTRITITLLDITRHKHPAMFSPALALFLQLWLATIAFAAPVSATSTPWQYGTGGGILGFIVLVLDIIVWIEIVKSSRPVSHKLLWCLLVFIFPIVGLIIYYFFSNRASHNSRGDYEPI
jgi:hypothetical protein